MPVRLFSLAMTTICCMYIDRNDLFKHPELHPSEYNDKGRLEAAVYVLIARACSVWPQRDIQWYILHIHPSLLGLAS